MNKKLFRIILTAVLLAAAYAIERTTDLPNWQLLIVYLVPYLIIGYDVIVEAGEGIVEGEPFNEDMLMVIATLGALCIGFIPDAETAFTEAVFVMLFFQIGELFEDYAEDKSRKSIESLMQLRPDVATVERDGNTVEMNPEEIGLGEIVVVRPGEKTALDGVIVEGSSSLNASALTGESLPNSVGLGDEVLAGCVNLSGLLKIKVNKSFGDSTVSKIIRLVEESAEKKSKSETFINRFAKIYTPIVVAAAVIVAFVPPFFYPSYAEAFGTWLYRALTFLIVSCPCALVISVPLAFFGGIGGASKRGILIKGGSYIDKLAKLDTIVFDKTGTLTKGEFEVTAVHPDKCAPTHLLHLAAHVERYSTHPIAVSLKNAYPDEQDDCTIEDITETAGQGISARVNGHSVCVGNALLMKSLNIDTTQCKDDIGTIVHVSIDGEYAGHIVVADTIKHDTKEAIENLKGTGIDRFVMLSGDREDVCKAVADMLHIDEYHSELLPNDKLDILEKVMENKGNVAFVGDGINDAPVLARADVGIAMGALGSDAAIESADVVLMNDSLKKIAEAIGISRHTVRIARQNVVFAIGVKIAVLVLAALGLTPMWLAVFADVGVLVLSVLNAMRTLNIK